MTTDNFLPYGKQSVGKAEIEAVSQVLAEPMITRGPKVEAFEKAVAERCEAPYAVAFSNGTAALQAAYFAAGIEANDTIVTTPNSFFASVGAGMREGGVPQFVDIDRSTGAIDIAKLIEPMQRLSSRFKKFVVPVHFAGIAVDMSELESHINNPATVVIEDAAHAIGSYYPTGEPVGSCEYSAMTIFSFHPVKTMTSGEGGMVTTRDEELYERLKLFRNNGIVRDAEKAEQAPWYYEVQECTGNFHMTDMQAALGLVQLGRLDEFVAKRRELVKRYREKLSGTSGVKLFHDKQDEQTAFHLMVAQIDYGRFGTNRAELMEKLREAGIGTQVHYIPLYHHPVIAKKMGDLRHEFPENEAYYARALSLPLFVDMSEVDVDRVCETLESSLS